MDDEATIRDADDDWAPWTWYGDDFPHEPDTPPPPDRLDRRELAVEGTGTNGEKGWRLRTRVRP